MTVEMLGRRRFAIITALMALGVAYRVVYVVDLQGKIDGDNAVVGLMARHILEGRHYVFFWGQAYMGSLEAYFVALAAAVFGLSDYVLRGVPLVFGVLFMASFYPLGAMIGGEMLGVTALALAALSPPLLASWSSAPRGGYPEMLFFGQLVLLLALRMTRDKAPAGLPSFVVLGFVAGLAFWTHPESLVFVFPAAVALVLHDRRIVLSVKPWLAGVAFLAGSIPVWIHQLGNRFATFSLVVEGPTGASVPVALRNLAFAHLPKVVGVRDLVGEQAILCGLLGYLVGAVIACAIGLQAVARIGDLARQLRGRSEPPGAEVLLVLVAVVLALYLPSRYGTWNTQRYLLPLYTAIIPLGAAAWLALGRRSRAAAAVAAIATLVVFARGAWSLHDAFRGPQQHSPYLPAIVDFMIEHGARHGYADHNEALVNTYRSDERVVLLDRSIRRYPIVELPDWNPTAVLTRGSGDDVARTLELLRCEFRTERFGSHTLIYDVTPGSRDVETLPRTGWHAAASINDAEAALAIDGDPRTRWASHQPQRPDMSLEIDLGRSESVSGIRVRAGAFATDVARGLRVEGYRESGEWTKLADVAGASGGFTIEAGVLRLSPQATLEIRFPSERLGRLRLVQTGTDPRFDWSITEVEALRDPASRSSS